MNEHPRKVEFYRHDLGEAELASVKQTLGSLFLTTGPRVAELEQQLASYLQVPHVVAVSSCTEALQLALLGLGVGPGDEVITTPMTFVATSNAVLYAGATPVFADVERETGLLDAAAVEAAITPRTKAIIVVHLYGQMADMQHLRAIADRHHLALVEDAAHGVEMRREGMAPGRIGDAAAFSFYATKTMTSGDGGAVAVRDPALASRLRRLRYHGISRDVAARHAQRYQHWDMLELGYKAGMTDICAALLIPQLKSVDARRDRREAIVRRYEQLLSHVQGVRLMRWSDHSAHHLFTFLSPADRRDELLSELGAAGIGVAVNYRAVHLLSYYRERFGTRRGMLPAAEEIGDRTISLPLYPTLADDEVDYVADRVRSLLAPG